MPRPPISKHWNDKIWEVRANEGADWSAARMSRRLEEIAANEGRNNPPHRTTVQRELDKIAQDQKRLGEFRYVYWPESFGERGELPWEASAAVLELLAVTEEEEVPRPAVSLARWFWRVSQSLPEEPLRKRRQWAGDLAAIDMSAESEVGRSKLFREVERSFLGLPPIAPTLDVVDHLHSRAKELEDVYLTAGIPVPDEVRTAAEGA